MDITDDSSQQKNVAWMRDELLPEAVYNHCFSEIGSREFVEFISVEARPLLSSRKILSGFIAVESYKARMTLHFSGEPKIFHLVIKLLTDPTDNRTDLAWDEFVNEEMFYNKMIAKYKLNIYPKCYVADMGRYGRPVIVYEDVEERGYVPRVDGKLDEDHLALCLKAIEGLHERGLALKAENFNSFREFYAKLIDTTRGSDTAESAIFFAEASKRISRVLEKLAHQGNEKINYITDEANLTICHGNLSSLDCFFFKYENDKPVDVKIGGWNKMRYCSIVFDLTCLLGPHISDEDQLEKLLLIYIDKVSK